jgi:two-component system response regulator HydG
MIDACATSPVLLGISAAMTRIRQDIARLAAYPLSLLIEGETGVGKEVVAQHLHLASRRKGALVAVNVAAIPEAMFESTMFGHRRGAFTGALYDHRGHFRESDGGTLFLDEVGTMSSSAQAKLLRAIESSMVRPVGERADIRVDTRIIAATSTPVRAMVQRGDFRPDLWYRLNGYSITIPPLRERVEDVRVLANHFLECAQLRLHGGSSFGFSDAAIDTLQEHDWPGNVRELRAVVLRSLACASGERISVAEVRDAIDVGRAAPRMDSNAVSSAERSALVEVLVEHAWDTSAAARALGVSRKTVYARIQRWRIEIPQKHHRRSMPMGMRDRPTVHTALVGEHQDARPAL